MRALKLLTMPCRLPHIASFLEPYFSPWPVSSQWGLARVSSISCKTARAGIYERAFVKRGRCRFCSAGLPHIPLAVSVGRSGPSQTLAADELVVQPAVHPLSPRPRESFLSLLAGSIRGGSRRDVIRSTIYSGSSGLPDVAIKPYPRDAAIQCNDRRPWGRDQHVRRGHPPGRHVHRPSLDWWLALSNATEFSSFV